MRINKNAKILINITKLANQKELLNSETFA